MHNIHDINHDIIKIYLYLTHITYSPWERNEHYFETWHPWFL